MARFRLRGYDLAPPGGYLYEQEGHKWAAPMIEPLAQQVSSWRKMNGKARSGFVESLQDVDNYQCRRMGNNPQYCVEVNPSPAAPQHALSETSPLIKPCAGCGAPVQQ